MTRSRTTLIIKIKSHFFFSWKRSGEAYNEPVLLSDMSDSLRSEVYSGEILAHTCGCARVRAIRGVENARQHTNNHMRTLVTSRKDVYMVIICILK